MVTLPSKPKGDELTPKVDELTPKIDELLLQNAWVGKMVPGLAELLVKPPEEKKVPSPLKIKLGLIKFR